MVDGSLQFALPPLVTWEARILLSTDSMTVMVIIISSLYRGAVTMNFIYIAISCVCVCVPNFCSLLHTKSRTQSYRQTHIEVYVVKLDTCHRISILVLHIHTVWCVSMYTLYYLILAIFVAKKSTHSGK